MNLDAYVPPRPDVWSGRVDDEHVREALRWHQVVEALLSPEQRIR
jgi:hypothetical protein